ncbi:hypothetical protein DXG03_006173 [Asterophora parasitica]|uniref:Uncharacterized protein n=1 Tax=Asterophora parasitica TaxID=117018 RepID=A0A9P7GDU4_9AGAR|nr:hypothetical protein DXG03_006173 [Asterophora parasitica]
MECKRPVNLVQLWRELKPLDCDTAETATPAAPPQGTHALIELAMQINSATPNSAATEQIFSQFGVKHSKLCNRIHPEKVLKEVLVKTNTPAKLGPPPRRKRAFGNDDGEEMIEVLVPTDNPAESARDPLDFTAIANEMVADASTDAPSGPIPAGQPRSAPSTSSTNYTILPSRSFFTILQHQTRSLPRFWLSRSAGEQASRVSRTSSSTTTL